MSSQAYHTIQTIPILNSTTFSFRAECWLNCLPIIDLFHKKSVNNFSVTLREMTEMEYDIVKCRSILKNYTGQQKRTLFFQNTMEIYTCSEAEWCPKHDVAFRFSLN